MGATPAPGPSAGGVCVLDREAAHCWGRGATFATLGRNADSSRSKATCEASPCEASP